MDKVADLVLDHPLVIQVPHAVTEILNQARTKHLSTSRLTKYEVALLSPTNVTIKRCTVLNPATLLPQDSEEGRHEGDTPTSEANTDQVGGTESDNEEQTHTQIFFPPHDCMELMKIEMKELDNVTDVLIHNADLELFVDGSRYYHEGSPRTGFAVTTLR